MEPIYKYFRSFVAFNAILWLAAVSLWKQTAGEPVHLMSVTPTPFVSNAVDPAQFICLLSDPDTAKLNEITTGRHITRGTSSALNTLDLPSRTTSSTDNALNKRTTTIPTTTTAFGIGEVQGVFYCEASNSHGVPTRVPVTILRGDQTHFEPLDGQFTVTANVGESVTLGVRILTSNTPSAVNPSTDVRWQKHADTPDGYITFDQSRFTSTADSSSFPINPVTVSDNGVYASYWRDYRQSFRFSLIRLIVRECPAGKWGPPTCISICDNCYNGGICYDKSGECVCRAGFTGPDCLTACGQDRFGWDCEHQCGANSAVAACPYSVFCMPDPAGCSCIPGWKGIRCNDVCVDGEFGAGCTETCHCTSGVICNRFTGDCATGNCATGWSGAGCQVPDDCPTGYWGRNCSGKCGCENCNQDTGSCLLASECLPGFAGPNCDRECHCLTGPSCVDRMTAKCPADDNTGLSLCEPGYMSVTGINLDNCAHYEGCFADCTKTCHCQGGVDYCNPVTGECTPAPDGKTCKDAWSGTSCQTDINECQSNPCVNGQCRNEINQYTCSCFDGWTGINCDINIDECASGPCQNGGACFDHINGYICQCIAGWTGTHCEINFDECASGPCVNGACVDQVNGYVCQCIAGWTGIRCDINFDECASGPCQNGGVCFDQVNGYVCQCIAGWTGIRCDINIDECASGPCQNGGACFDQVNGYVCQCIAGWTGTRCDIILPRLTEAPTIVPGSVGATSVTIQLNTWNPAAGDTGDGPVIGYKIYYAELPTGIRMLGGFIHQTQSPTVPVTITSLQPGTEYVIQVSAVREGPGGEGLPSPIVVVTTLPITTPSPSTSSPLITASPPSTSAPRRTTTAIPATLTVETSEETSITISWVRLMETNETIRFYHIVHRAIDKPYEEYFQPTRSSTFLLPVNDQAQTVFVYLLDDLEPSTLYEILVSPVVDSGQGEPEILEVYTRGASDIPNPSTPTVLTSSDTTITITFPALESKYLVSYKFGVENIDPISKREAPSFSDNGDAYITASISKFEYDGKFTIGDGKVYGKDHNLPLEKGEKYNIYVGASSGLNENEVVKWSAVPLVAAASSSRQSSVSATVGGVVSVTVVIIIVIIIVLVILKRRRDHQNGPANETTRQKTGKTKTEVHRYENQIFNANDEEYEDLDDPGYEDVTSSKWDISWDNLNLSGKILGKGNFGEVQLARVWINDKWIKAAVKTLKEGTPESERTLFKDEFDTMTKVGHHPNVVNILGSCEHEGSLYVVLEYVPHGNLRKFLRKSRKEAQQKDEDVLSQLAPEQLLKFGIDVAKAMKHIANCGIIHRDLAARNILVGRGLTAKVADFGMSRDDDIYVQTSSRRVPTRWLSIESLTRKTYTTKSDVWSFGILLWEIATFGGTPYAGMETKHLAYHLTTEGYRMPKPDNCEHEMYDLMRQCWQEDPDDRPTFAAIVGILNDMSSKEKIYMSTHYLKNFHHAAISLDRDDK
ncbi:uncharacterized protein [Amphiura filiformis]|uniref:uncharacterized protein n=1 Tax=Amphiura filiformis TaxID=82378 RepID=UPI003B2280FE